MSNHFHFPLVLTFLFTQHLVIFPFHIHRLFTFLFLPTSFLSPLHHLHLSSMFVTFTLLDLFNLCSPFYYLYLITFISSFSSLSLSIFTCPPLPVHLPLITIIYSSPTVPSSSSLSLSIFTCPINVHLPVITFI